MKINKLLLTSIICCTLATVGVAASIAETGNIQETPIVSKLENTNGINLRKAKTGTNSNNQEYITFNYTLTPANTMQKEVNVSAIYKDNTVCSDALKIDVNQSDKTITLTCLKAFTKQILLTVACKANDNIKATATVDYRSKATKVNTTFGNKPLGDNTDLNSAWSWMQGDGYVNNFYIDRLINYETVTGSITANFNNYTLDGTVTTPSNDNAFNDVQGVHSMLNSADTSEEFISSVRNAVANKIFNRSNSLPNHNDIYALAKGNQEIINTLNTIAQSDDIETGWDAFLIEDFSIYFEETGQEFDLPDLIVCYSLSNMGVPSEYFVSTTNVGLEQSSFYF